MIARLLNREFLISDDEDRQQYLLRLGRAITSSDWTLLSYAIMSSHPHWLAIAGQCSFESIARPIHSSFARWLNSKYGRLGPVFAERPKTFTVEPSSVARLTAYLHNNPVRARVVDAPVDTTWTSHRAYVGLETAPTWLDVELGLELAGFSADAEGRAAFGGFVVASIEEPTDPLFSCGDVMVLRTRVRQALGPTIELGSPTVDLHSRMEVYPLLTTPGTPLQPRWDGPLDAVLLEVAVRTRVPIASIQSRRRTRRVTFARRVAVVAAVGYLGRHFNEIAPYISVSAEAAGQLARGADKSCHELARRIAGAVAKKRVCLAEEILEKRINFYDLQSNLQCSTLK